MNNKKKDADSVKRCANCDTVDSNLTCAKCKVTIYCSKACQKQHWKHGHKQLCVTPEERRPQAMPSREVRGGSRGAQDDDNSGECPVCLDSLSGCAVCMLPCNHTFHQGCVEQLRKLGVQQVCPLCRTALPAGAEKLFDDATREYVAVLHQVGDGGHERQSLTRTQQKKMAVIFEMFTNAANQGHAPAQLNLGVMYRFGYGVAQDAKKAVQWNRKAADQGHVLAQCNLGGMYFHGEGVAQNVETAAQWYRRAADQGNATAQCNLGIMYRHGQGVAQDYDKSVQWYHKAVDQGNADAQYNLGRMHYHGHGVAWDFEKAAHLYRKAADQGDKDAQCNLGTMHHKGEGVSQDFKKAAYWYCKAADQGDKNAQYNLGFLYRNGEGVAKDLGKAAQCFRKAADQGHAGALMQMSLMS